MKSLYSLLILVFILQGCASFKGTISNEDKISKSGENKTSSDSTAKSLTALNESVKTQLDEQKQLNEQKNVQTKVVEENATIHQAGASVANGKRGDGATSISQMVRHGRIKATGTYFYGSDSIYMQLTIGDTVINIHKKITLTDDQSKVQSKTNTNNTTQLAMNNTTSTAIENKAASDTKSSNKLDIKTKASFSASIGISNWWPVIIALIIGLSIGIPLGRKSKN